MHPQAFLDLAAELKRRPAERYYRTSVSRSYQAAFLFARRFLQLGNVPVSKGPSGHQEVYECLFNTAVAEVRRAARHLNNLRTQRNKADYCLTWTGGTRRTAESWYQVAEDVFKAIQQVDAAPQKQEILDAARRHLAVRRGNR